MKWAVGLDLHLTGLGKEKILLFWIAQQFIYLVVFQIPLHIIVENCKQHL